MIHRVILFTSLLSYLPINKNSFDPFFITIASGFRALVINQKYCLLLSHISSVNAKSKRRPDVKRTRSSGLDARQHQADLMCSYCRVVSYKIVPCTALHNHVILLDLIIC